MTNINFDSKDLKVDYLSFNLQFNNHEQIQEIAEVLCWISQVKNGMY
jgi:hypothetical protein